MTPPIDSVSVSYFLSETESNQIPLRANEAGRNHDARGGSSNALAVISVLNAIRHPRERRNCTEIKRTRSAVAAPADDFGSVDLG